MSFTPVPPSLADIGWILFGEYWRKSLANALEVTEDQVIGWLSDPSGMPVDLEARIEKVGQTRVEEIRFMLGHMLSTGLDRSSE
jgi:hypothetical protein